MNDHAQTETLQEQWRLFTRVRRREIAQAWIGGLAYPLFVITLATIGTIILRRTLSANTETGASGRIPGVSPMEVVAAFAVGSVLLGTAIGISRRSSRVFSWYDASVGMTAELARGESFPRAIRTAGYRATEQEIRETLQDVAHRCDTGVRPEDAFAGTRYPPDLRRCIGTARRTSALVEILSSEIDQFSRREQRRLGRLAATLRPAGVVLGGGVLLWLVLRVYLPAIESIVTFHLEGL